MELLYSSQDLAQIEILSGILAERGIFSEIRNPYMMIARGSVPYTDTWPELWVTAADAVAAKAVLDEREAADTGTSWTCPSCGEVLEPQFSSCWKCSTARPAAGSADVDHSPHIRSVKRADDPRVHYQQPKKPHRS